SSTSAPASASDSSPCWTWRLGAASRATIARSRAVVIGGSTSVVRGRGESVGQALSGPGVLGRFSLPRRGCVSYYDHVVREADPQHGSGRGRAEDHEGGRQQRPMVAVVQQRGDGERAQDLADGVSGGQQGDRAGEAQVGPGGQGEHADAQERAAE